MKQKRQKTKTFETVDNVTHTHTHKNNLKESIEAKYIEIYNVAMSIKRENEIKNEKDTNNSALNCDVHEKWDSSYLHIKCGRRIVPFFI